MRVAAPVEESLKKTYLVRVPPWCEFRPCAFFGGDRCCSRSFLRGIVCQTVRRFFVQNVEPWKTIRPGSLVSLVKVRNAVARSLLPVV